MLGKAKGVETQNHIQEEAEQFGDLIQEDFFDDYFNLTLKSLFSLKYFTEHQPRIYTHMLKVDDDCFFNMDSIESLITVGR